MAEALDSDKIARHAFEVGRRGYEQQEVRAFLHEVSSLVQRLERQIVEQRERAVHAEAQLEQVGAPDEAMLLERLGEETTRVLSSAREAAAEIRAKAEVEAERIVAHATLDAAEARAEAMRGADRRVVEAEAERESLLHDARTELDRRRAEAEEVASRIRDDATAEIAAIKEEAHQEAARLRDAAEEAIEAARAQGRDMVAEAQAVRERVLHDLAVRRKKARRQIEKLNAGRERLLQAYDVVRRLIDEATDELGVSLTDARAAADAAARRVEDEPEPSLEELAEEMSTAPPADLTLLDEDHDELGGHDDDYDELGDQDDDPAAAPPRPEPGGRIDVGGQMPSPGGGTGRAGDPPGLAASAESRRRKGRRRKGGYVGLPAGVETTADEGVSLRPANLDDEAPTGDAPNAAAREDMPRPDRAATAEAADVEADLQRARERVREAELAAERQRTEKAERERLRAEEAEREAELAAERQQAEEAERERLRAEKAERARAESADAERKAQSEREAEAERVAAEAREAERAAELAGSRDVIHDADEPASPTVTDLFARLRAETNVDPAPAEAHTSEPPSSEPQAESSGEPTAFAAREAVLGPIVKQLNRGLKRALADEQNEVLDRLRRAKPRSVDDLLPAADDHAARWAEVAAEALAEAAAAGASWSGGLAGSVADLADELARSLTAPLRDRIDRSFAASDGNLDDVADRVRALYREWKGQRLAETAQHHAAAAYARGVYDALGVKVPVHWVVDPDGVPCPDCDDNVLGGTVPRGTEFPTGHDCAPAHPGCRCLVLATDG